MTEPTPKHVACSPPIRVIYAWYDQHPARAPVAKKSPTSVYYSTDWVVGWCFTKPLHPDHDWHALPVFLLGDGCTNEIARAIVMAPDHLTDGVTQDWDSVDDFKAWAEGEALQNYLAQVAANEKRAARQAQST
jgi:hypothetical protein